MSSIKYLRQLKAHLKEIEFLYTCIIDTTMRIEDDPRLSLLTRAFFIFNDLEFRKQRIMIKDKLTELSKIIGTDEDKKC